MIRRIAATDLEETLGVFRRACAASHPFLAPQFLCHSEAAMRDRTLLAWDTDVVEDGAIRGFLCRKETFIEALFIDPPFQSRGLGKCLHRRDDHPPQVGSAMRAASERSSSIGGFFLGQVSPTPSSAWRGSTWTCR